MMRIGLDASGGDNGEVEVVKAVINYFKNNSDIEIVLFGDESIIKNEFAKQNVNINNLDLDVIDAKDRIDMNDHPIIAIRTKTDSPIVKAGKYLQDKMIDAFISAGNTGALVAMAQFYLKPINGVDRPVLGAIIPTNNNPMLLIDSGCNVDSKAEWLYQYSLLANSYYKLMFNKDNPSIALLSVGTEENKGNNLTIAAYSLIKNNHELNFIGNVEARDLPRGICDILITDGFAGNVFLKTYEGTAKLMFELIKKQIKSSFIGKIGGLLIKPCLKELLSKYDAKKYGGAPILGTNHLLIKCHGNSHFEEYLSAINQAKILINNQFINVVKNTFEG
jgi:glycerol-3-phosphate acyltransferase PlsX